MRTTRSDSAFFAILGVMRVAIVDRHNPEYNIIVMIAIAAITFYLIVTCIMNTVKAHKMENRNLPLIILRNISLAGVIGALLSMERSMLGTFGNAAGSFALLIEAATGAIAFLLLLAMGIAMIAANPSRQGSYAVRCAALPG